MKIAMFDGKTGKPAGFAEVPDDVIEAAVKVRAWLRNQDTIGHSPAQICGLKLVEN